MSEQAQTPKFHPHPKNVREQIYGVQLAPGAVLDAATDVYDGTSGCWEACPCPGMKLPEGVATIWIRRMPEPAGTIRVPFDRPPLPPV